MQSNKKFVKLPFNVTIASAETIVQLMVFGYLEVGENGLTTKEPGIYKTENFLQLIENRRMD